MAKSSNSLLWGSTSHGSCWLHWGLSIPTMWRGQCLSWFTWAGGDRAHKRRSWQHRGLQKALCTLHSISEVQSNSVPVHQYRSANQPSFFQLRTGALISHFITLMYIISTWERCRPVTILTYPKFSYDDQWSQCPSMLLTDSRALSHRQLHPDQHMPLLPLWQQRAFPWLLGLRPGNL